MALGQLDSVPVRILDESIDISAAGPIGSGTADEFNTFGFELVAELITICIVFLNHLFL